jgi:hypothetical protein
MDSREKILKILNFLRCNIAPCHLYGVVHPSSNYIETKLEYMPREFSIAGTEILENLWDSCVFYRNHLSKEKQEELKALLRA